MNFSEVLKRQITIEIRQRPILEPLPFNSRYWRQQVVLNFYVGFKYYYFFSFVFLWQVGVRYSVFAGFVRVSHLQQESTLLHMTRRFGIIGIIPTLTLLFDWCFIQCIDPVNYVSNVLWSFFLLYKYESLKNTSH